MTKPRMTKEPLDPDRGAPSCPHCGGTMEDSTITLDALIAGWPVPERVAVEADGYAHGYHHLTVTCGWCAAPSVLAIDWRDIKLVALRTEKDERYLASKSNREDHHAAQAQD